MQKEEKLSREEIQQLEQQFHAEKRKFFEYNKQYLESMLNDTALENTNSLLRFIIDSEEISINTFKFVGGVLDILGLDFTSQTYMNKDVCLKVRERLDTLGFCFSEDKESKFDLIDSKFIIENIIDFVHNTDFRIFNNAFESMSKELDKPIEIDSNSLQTIIYNIKKLFAHSSINISYIYDLNNTLNKNRSELTYRDILKLNSTIAEHTNYNGQSAFQAYRQVYGNTKFPDLLNKAVELYDLTRYAHIYVENIISLKEIINTKFTLSDIKFMIFGSLEDQCWNESKETFEKQIEENRIKSEAENKDTVQTQLHDKYQNNMDDIMAKDPIQALMIISHEALGEEMTSVDKLVEGFERVCNSDEYLADIYKYVKARYSTITGEETMGEYGFDPKHIVQGLGERIQSTQSEYKEIAQLICKSLTQEQTTELNNLMNGVIEYLVLDNPQNRSYVLSQYYDPKLTTVQHVIQMMNLVESCTILTKDEAISAYTKLYNYTIENFKESIEEVSKSEPLTNKISFLLGVKQIFDKWIEVKK